MRPLTARKVIRMCRRGGRPDLIRKLEARLVQIEEAYRTDPGQLVELARRAAARSRRGR